MYETLIQNIAKRWHFCRASIFSTYKQCVT